MVVGQICSGIRCEEEKTRGVFWAPEHVVVGEDVSGHWLRGDKTSKHEDVFWTPEYVVVGGRFVLACEEEKIQGMFWAPEHVEDDDVEDDKICW